MAKRGRFDADTAVGFCNKCKGEPPQTCADERRDIERQCMADYRRNRNRDHKARQENSRFVAGRERYNELQRKKKEEEKEASFGFGRKGKKRPKGEKVPLRRQVQERNMTWKDKHCGPALFTVNSVNLEERMKKLSEISDTMFADIQEYAEDLGLSIAKERLKNYALAAGGRYAATGLCAAAGAAAGAPAAGVGAVPGAAVGGGVCAVAATVVNIASGLWNLYSGARAVAQSWQKIDKMLDILSSVRNNAQVVLDAAQDPKALKTVQSELGEAMAAAADASPCLKARKCYLVPYETKRKQGPDSMDQRGPGGIGMFDAGFARGGIADLSDSRGCCPGQTGHHLLPETMFKNCAAYTKSKHAAAPTVCAEGVNHSQGSHGKLHDALDDILRRHHGKGEPLSMDQATDHAVKSMEDSEVGDHCKAQCLKDQLKRFYDTLPCTPEAKDSGGRLVGPNQGTEL